MHRSLFTLGLLAFCGGCVSPSARQDEERIRAVAANYVGDAGKIAGPFFSRSKVELQRLESGDLDHAIALLERGAAGFLVFGPDYGIVLNTERAPLMDFIELERIVLVLDGRIAGDYPAMKTDSNQSPQRNAGTRPSSDGSSVSETSSSLGPRG